MMKQIKDMSDIELKALIFDISENIQKLQNDAMQIKQLLFSRQQNLKEEKPKKEEKK